MIVEYSYTTNDFCLRVARTVFHLIVSRPFRLTANKHLYHFSAAQQEIATDVAMRTFKAIVSLKERHIHACVT